MSRCPLGINGIKAGPGSWVPVRKRRNSAAHGPKEKRGLRSQRLDPHRPRDVLDALFPHVLEGVGKRSPMWSLTVPDTQTPPGAANPPSRAAMLTP